MKWEKIGPHSMPPEYKNIIAIIEDIYGNKHIDTNI